MHHDQLRNYPICAGRQRNGGCITANHGLREPVVTGHMQGANCPGWKPLETHQQISLTLTCDNVSTDSHN